MNPIRTASISELRAHYASGALTPLAVTARFISRIDAYDPQLRAFVAVDRERALADAANPPPGPLHGIPIAIKSNIDVAGLVTTAGLEGRRHIAPAAADAPVVARLRAAGAIILGHVNMHEAAVGATTDNEAYGRTMNPHRIGHTPGGSSGGSGAAVAAGLCVAALGTDTLGSVRIPAAYNGIFGLKPTPGLVDDTGLVPLSKRFDAIGPLARSVDDLVIMMAAMADIAPASPVSKIALLDVVGRTEVERAVRKGYELAASLLEGLGNAVQTYAFDVDLPKVRLGAFVEALDEGRAYYADDLVRDPGGFSDSLLGLFGFAASSPAEAKARGAAEVARAATTLHAILADADAILLPTSPQVAFAHGSAPVTQADFTALANVAGLPALSLPAGWSDDGLPVGVQLVGRAGGEATLLALARSLDAVMKGYAPPPDFA